MLIHPFYVLFFPYCFGGEGQNAAADLAYRRTEPRHGRAGVKVAQILKRERVIVIQPFLYAKPFASQVPDTVHNSVNKLLADFVDILMFQEAVSNLKTKAFQKVKASVPRIFFYCPFQVFVIIRGGRRRPK